jgi:hypothetical protein
MTDEEERSLELACSEAEIAYSAASLKLRSAGSPTEYDAAYKEVLASRRLFKSSWRTLKAYRVGRT